MEAKSILIGVPSAREDSKFLASLLNLLPRMKAKYKVELLMVKWKPLPEAQENIVDYFMSKDFDYLLFLDDDHWGHTVEMVDALVDAKADFVTMKTYIRHFPYVCALYRKNDNGNWDAQTLFDSIDKSDGYEQVDMCGFPMTLLTKRVFKALEKPYFVTVTSNGRDWNTDVPFCRRLSEVGIKPVGCFKYCLPHGEITQENIEEKRNHVGMTWIDRYVKFVEHMDNEKEFQEALNG